MRLILTLALLAAGCGGGTPTKAVLFDRLQKGGGQLKATNSFQLEQELGVKLIVDRDGSIEWVRKKGTRKDELSLGDDEDLDFVRFVCSDGYVSGETVQSFKNKEMGPIRVITDTLKIE